MNEDRPFVQIPIPSPEDIAAYKEWLEKHKQEENQEEKERVVILQL